MDEQNIIDRAISRYHRDTKFHAEVERALFVARKDRKIDRVIPIGLEGVDELVRLSICVALFLRDIKDV